MTTGTFGLTFGHPWQTTEGSAQSELVPFPYDVAIGGRPYVVDWLHYVRLPLQPFREARDFDASPGEHSLNTQSAWKRNRDNWLLGGGQYHADGPNSTDYRFHTSKGVDWTVDRQLSLLHDTEQALTSASTNLRTLNVGGYLYVLDNTKLKYTNAPHDATITWTEITLSAAGVDMCTDGAKVYVVVTGGGGIYTYPVGSSTPTHMGGAAATSTATVIAVANGWLMAGVGAKLTSYSAAGAEMASPFTQPLITGAWTAIIGAPNAIYAAFAANDRSIIYRLGVDNTGALTVPIAATELPAGETVQALGYYASRLLIGTTRGVRLGEIAGDGSVALGPLVRAGSCRCFASFEELSFFGWTNYDSASTGLGAMRLADFTDANVPAYSTWLQAATQGTVSAVTIVDGQPWFTVVGAGLYRPAATYVASGAIDLGWFTFGVHEPKSWSCLELVTEPLVGAVGVQLLNDDGEVRDLGTVNVQGTTGVGDQLPALGHSGEQAAITLTLYRDIVTGTHSPVVRRVTLRALPNPVQFIQWTVPLILKSRVLANMGDGQEIGVDVKTEWDFLLNLAATQRPVIYQEANQRHVVRVRLPEIPEQMATHWDAVREGLESTTMVTLVSVLPE